MTLRQGLWIYPASVFAGMGLKLMTATLLVVSLWFFVEPTGFVDKTPALSPDQTETPDALSLFALLVIASPIFESAFFVLTGLVFLKLKLPAFLYVGFWFVGGFLLHGASLVDLEAGLAFSILAAVWWLANARWGGWHAYLLCSTVHAGFNTTALIAILT